MTSENPYFPGGLPSSEQAEEPYDDETPPSIAIIRAIAAIEDTDPVESASELNIRLYDQIDPEALDRLFLDGDGDGDVFVHLTLYTEDEYDALIHDSGQVIVRKRD